MPDEKDIVATALESALLRHVGTTQKQEVRMRLLADRQEQANRTLVMNVFVVGFIRAAEGANIDLTSMSDTQVTQLFEYWRRLPPHSPLVPPTLVPLTFTLPAPAATETPGHPYRGGPPVQHECPMESAGHECLCYDEPAPVSAVVTRPSLWERFLSWFRGNA